MTNEEKKQPPLRKMGDLMREDEDKVLARVKAELREEQARLEDILGSPKATMMKLMRFILNEPDIEGTVIERYIDLTVQEKAPEIYKPR